MKHLLASALVGFAALLSSAAGGFAQSSENPALNNPDQLSWQLFLKVNASAGGTNALFETWASDTDTFTPSPTFPAGPTPLALHSPIVPTIGMVAIQEGGGLVPAVPPNPAIGEETRRNQAAFDFIVSNNLHKRSGLVAAFGKPMSFPVDAIEIKANWIPVEDVPAHSKQRVTVADVAKFFHVNTGTDGKKYALVAMHVITKGVPNWTWATFESEFNPGRCDIIGCRDAFGAVNPSVPANTVQNQGYPACDKTPAVKALFAAASPDPAFAHYCLKGSQVDFTDSTGLDVRLGNSVTEDGFVRQSSCMSCHGRANFRADGKPTSSAGFNADGSAPLGPIQPNWYWAFSASPPIFQGMPGLTRLASSADFVWSVPFCAIDDTVNPPRKSPCLGK